VVTRPIDAIRESEIPTVFSERAVQRIVANAKLPGKLNLPLLLAAIRWAAEHYVREVREPTPNTIRREIKSLYQAAKGERPEEVVPLLMNLSSQARRCLERTNWIPTPTPAQVRELWPTRTAKEIEVVLGRSDRRVAFFALPDLAALQDPAQVSDACQRIVNLCVFGGHFIEGRKRIDGRRSRERRALFQAPEASRSEPRRNAERSLCERLRLAYADATGKMPPKTASLDFPGPFARLVAECLRLVRAIGDDHDPMMLAVQLINDSDKRRKQRELRSDWRDATNTIPNAAAILNEIESGAAVVLRLPAGLDVDQVRDVPSLIEIEETGTLCFYYSAALWRTIKIPTKQRESLMNLAGRLCGGVRTLKSGLERGGPSS
jgi:hypothetical protein